MPFEKPSCCPRSNHGVSVAADASEPQARSRCKSGGLGGTSRTPQLQINQLRDPLAVVRRVTERELGRLGALEVEVQIVLPGEPDAAVELDARASDLPV